MALFGALAGIAGGIIGGRNERRAIEDSTEATLTANREALEEIRRQFDVNRNDRQPFLDVGVQANDRLAALYGLSGSSPSASAPAVAPQQASFPQNAFNLTGVPLIGDPLSGSAGRLGGIFRTPSIVPQGPAASATGVPNTGQTPQGLEVFTSSPEFRLNEIFQASPDYQFRLDESLRAVGNNASARGLVNSGSRLKAILERAGNLASGEFGNFTNLFRDFGSSLFNLSGRGQQTVEANAADGNRTAGAAASIAQNSGNAIANGALASGVSRAGTIGDMAGGIRRLGGIFGF